jgi:hypothetical protein
MQSRPGFRASIVAAILFLLAGSAYANNLSFTGNFTQDDQMQVLAFAVASGANVTFETFGYAGGTNGAGQIIAEGGFAPDLSLYDASGNLIGQSDTGSPAIDLVTGVAFDVLFTEPLTAGNYSLVLTQDGNFANGPTLADGFSQTGNANFTAALGCTNGIFCDMTTANRDGNWAVDINIEVTTSSSVPEPGTVVAPGALLLLSLIGLGGVAKARAVRQ